MLKLWVIVFAFGLGQVVNAQVLDSLRKQISFPDTLFFKQQLQIDSIQTEASSKFTKLKNTFDSVDYHYTSLATRIQMKVDSLTHLSLPTEKLQRKIDSLNQIKNDKLAVIKSSVEKVKANTVGKLEQLNLPPELSEEVKKYTSAIDKLDITLPNTDIKIPTLSLNNGLNLSLPKIDNPFGGSLPSLNTSSIPGAENLQQLTSKASELQHAVPTSIDGVGKLAENQLSKVDQLGEVKGQLGNLPTNPMTSEEEAKKQLLNQAKQAAVDHFAGKEDVLKSAMDKMSKYKQKYSHISSLSEITQRPPNPMKEKRFIERVVPGIQFQIFKKQGNFITDVNLYAGYRVNGRITTGIGWNQRYAYDLDKDEFNPKARIFGPRAFGEFKLNKGISPRLEVEAMNSMVPPFTSPAKVDDHSREWVVSALVGIKKEYRFYKNIKGTTTILLNVIHPHNKNLYPDVVNARFGFEFPIKKK